MQSIISNSGKVKCEHLLFALEMVHQRLNQNKRMLLPSADDFRSAFKLSIQESRCLRNELITSHRSLLLKDVASMQYQYGDLIYLPMGSSCNIQLLEWCGGLIDGDGCVVFDQRSRTSGTRIVLGQNSRNVTILYNLFGGNLCYNQPRWRWEAVGIRSYFIANILRDYTYKKQAELDAIIDFHHGLHDGLSFSAYIREKKDSYPYQEYDVSSWPLSRLAGWIDSDGTITLLRSKDCCHYPLIILSQYNASLVRSMKENFGGSISNPTRRREEYQWRIMGKKAIEFLEKIYPYLIHKRKHATKILQKYPTYTSEDIQSVSALNAINSKFARSRYNIKYGEAPEEWLALSESL